jgi:hypothetical protein
MQLAGSYAERSEAYASLDIYTTSDWSSVVQVIGGHTISPDGTRIVSGSDDKTVQIWDTVTGKQLAVLEGHTTWVQSVAFSPDGAHIVSGSSDETIRVWDVHTAKQLAVLKGYRGAQCMHPQARPSYARKCTASNTCKHVASGTGKCVLASDCKLAASAMNTAAAISSSSTPSLPALANESSFLPANAPSRTLASASSARPQVRCVLTRKCAACSPANALFLCSQTPFARPQAPFASHKFPLLARKLQPLARKRALPRPQTLRFIRLQARVRVRPQTQQKSRLPGHGSCTHGVNAHARTNPRAVPADFERVQPARRVRHDPVRPAPRMTGRASLTTPQRDGVPAQRARAL